MGRQIQFYMQPEDRDEFLRLVQERDSVVVTVRDSDSAAIKPIVDLDRGLDKTICLWNRNILPRFKRKWLPVPQRYRVDTLNMPVLEFDSSFSATWEGKPALGKGRLFGNFEPYLRKPREFEKWYETLVRWIRKNYRRSPTSLGGYLGPMAWEFFEHGGYLLPQFLPPRTQVWLDEIAKEHALSNIIP